MMYSSGFSREREPIGDMCVCVCVCVCVRVCACVLFIIRNLFTELGGCEVLRSAV